MTVEPAPSLRVSGRATVPDRHQDALDLAVELPLSEDEAAYVEAARAPNTLRGYRSDWAAFSTWCLDDAAFANLAYGLVNGCAAWRDHLRVKLLVDGVIAEINPPDQELQGVVLPVRDDRVHPRSRP